MPPPQASEQLYTTLQRYQLLLVVAGRRLWRQMAPGNFDASWQRIAPSLTTLTAGAQLASAQAAVAYVPAVLEETGQPDRPQARVRPQAFAGMASDGRSLEGLLEGSVAASKRGIARGLDGGDALVGGQKWLEQALQTAVSDAARDATAAMVVARPGLGWVRIANPPCCSRCAVLGATFYRWNEPNPRHPGCDCVTQPVTETDSGAYLMKPDDLVKRGLVNDLTPAQMKRLADGDDLVKVLNESRDRWRERMAADRRARGPVDRLGRTRPAGWAGGGSNPPPVGTTIHELMARLTSRVDAINAMRDAGIAT